MNTKDTIIEEIEGENQELSDFARIDAFMSNDPTEKNNPIDKKNKITENISTFISEKRFKFLKFEKNILQKNTTVKIISMISILLLITAGFIFYLFFV